MRVWPSDTGAGKPPWVLATVGQASLITHNRQASPQASAVRRETMPSRGSVGRKPLRVEDKKPLG